MPRFLNRTDDGLLDGYSLATNVDSQVDDLTNAEELKDLKMLTSVFNYSYSYSGPDSMSL